MDYMVKGGLYIENGKYVLKQYIPYDLLEDGIENGWRFEEWSSLKVQKYARDAGIFDCIGNIVKPMSVFAHGCSGERIEFVISDIGKQEGK